MGGRGCRRQPVQHPRQRIPIRAKHAPAAQQRRQLRRCQAPQAGSLVQRSKTRAGGGVGEVRGENPRRQIGSARLPQKQRSDQGTFSSPTALHDRDRARCVPQQRHQMTQPLAWARQATRRRRSPRNRGQAWDRLRVGRPRAAPRRAGRLLLRRLVLERRGHTHDVLVTQNYRAPDETAANHHDVRENLNRAEEPVVLRLNDQQLSVSQPPHG
jgi:hypothetical protein